MAICKFCKFDSKNPSLAFCSMCGKLLPGYNHPVTIHKGKYDELVTKAIKYIEYETYGCAPPGKVLVNFSDYEILKNKVSQQVDKVFVTQAEYHRLKDAQRQARYYEAKGYAPKGKILVEENEYKLLKKRVEAIESIKVQGWAQVAKKTEAFASKIVNAIKEFIN